MAKIYRYFTGHKRTYNRRKSSRSSRAVSFSRAFRASAANMTQNGKFNISTKFNEPIKLVLGESYAFKEIDIPNYIVLARMHRALSNVFDQYKIEKVTLKFNLLTNSDPIANDVSHVAFFTCSDRTGFASNVNISSLRSYGSYNETVWSVNGKSNPPHFVKLGQADLAGKCEYYDTKNRASFPKVVAGFDLGQAVTTAKTLTFTCEVDAQIRYRGIRCDNTGVLARISLF